MDIETFFRSLQIYYSNENNNIEMFLYYQHPDQLTFALINWIGHFIYYSRFITIFTKIMALYNIGICNIYLNKYRLYCVICFHKYCKLEYRCYFIAVVFTFPLFLHLTIKYTHNL